MERPLLLLLAVMLCIAFIIPSGFAGENGMGNPVSENESVGVFVNGTESLAQNLTPEINPLEDVAGEPRIIQQDLPERKEEPGGNESGQVEFPLVIQRENKTGTESLPPEQLTPGPLESPSPLEAPENHSGEPASGDLPSPTGFLEERNEALSQVPLETTIGSPMESAGKLTTDAIVGNVSDEYRFVLMWGSMGEGDGQISSPWDIATDASGNVYAITNTDRFSNQNQVQIFDPNGTRLAGWSMYDTPGGRIPSGIAVNSAGTIYVSDRWNDAIRIHAPDGRLLGGWGGVKPSDQYGESDPASPRGITADAHDDVYVGSISWFNQPSRIQKFFSNGSFIKAWKVSTNPVDIAVDQEGYVYATFQQPPRVVKYTPDGNIVTAWRLKGSTYGQDTLIGGISVAPDGNVFVTYPENHSVQKYTPQGVLLTQLGSQGNQAGQLYYPTSCAVDGAGNVYVMDSGNYRIQKFAPAASPNHPPTLFPVGPQEVSLGATLRLPLKASDPDGDSLRYSYGLLPGLIPIEGAAIDPVTGIFAWKPTNAQTGHWNIQFKVTDGADTDSENVDIYVSGLNHNPVIGEGLKDTYVFLGETLQFPVPATDEDRDTLEYFFSPYLPGAGLDRSTGIFTWIPEGILPGNYVVEFNVFDGKSITSRQITITVLPRQPPITPEPVQKPNAWFEIMPEKNVMDLGGTNMVTIRPRGIYAAPPLEVTILMDGVPVTYEIYNTADIKYAFTTRSPGIHTISAEARTHGQTITGFRSIDVRSGMSPALDMARTRERDANSEIDQAITLSAEKNVEYYVETPGQIFDLIFDFMKVASLANTADLNKAHILAKLDVLKATHGVTLSVLKHIEKESIAQFPMGPVVTGQITVMEKGYDILSTRRSINEQVDALALHIRIYPDQYQNSIDLQHLFLRYSAPLSRVVEEYRLAGDSPGVWNSPMMDAAEFYERFRYASDLEGREYDLLESYAGGAIAVTLHKTSAFEILNGIAGYAVPLYGYAQGVQNGYTMIMKGLLTTTLNMGVPVVSDQVEHLHRVGAQAIMDGVRGESMREPAMVNAPDTRIFTPTEVTSSGYPLVVTPYGSIVDIMPRNGEFTPEVAGKYSLVSYQHRGHLFSDIAQATFTASKPNVTVNLSQMLEGNRLAMTMEVRNHEADPVDHVGILFDLKNTTEGPEYYSGEEFNLAGGESRVLTMNLTLPRNGTYTGTVTLTYRTLIVLQQTSFLVSLGETEDDVAIISVETEDTYPPSVPVTLNVTLESSRSATLFDLVVPEAGVRETVNLNGRETKPLNLPAMQPGRYPLTLIAEKDGRTLDSRTVELVVTAQGVGFLVLQPDASFIPSPEPVPVTVSLKDLVMNGIDANVDVAVTDPDGNRTVEHLTLTGGSGTGRFLLSPKGEGTYLLDGSASKPGWSMVNSSATVVVGNMSRLSMDVSLLNETVIVMATSNGRPAFCAITYTTDNLTVTRSAPDGISLFNRTESFELVAEKLYYENAFFQYPVPGLLPGLQSNFTANTSAGPAPLVVQFTDTSWGSPDTWSWNFGDGAVSGDQNPVHIFLTAGNYSVNLTVWNPSGSSSRVMPLTVTPQGPEPAGDTLQPNVTIKSPSKGSIWYGNQKRQILWKAMDNIGVTGIDIDYSLDNGTTWAPIASSQKNSGAYLWKVVDADGKKSLIRITARDAAGNKQSAKVSFIIRKART